MIDRREQIIERLVAIVGTIPGVVLTGRNLIDPPDSQLPAIIIHDGDEESDEDDVTREQARGGRAPGPVRVAMHPLLVVSVEPPPTAPVTATDGTVSWEDQVGPVLSAFRLAILKAVLFDAPLAAVYTTNGRVVYHGMTSYLDKGAAVIGRSALTFRIVYPLIPQEL